MVSVETIKSLRSSIGRDLVLQVSCASLLLTALLSIIGTYFEYKKELTSIEFRMDNIIHTQADIVATSLWQFDEMALTALANGILHDPYFCNVTITQRDGTVISAGGKKTKETTERMIPLFHQTSQGRIQVGSLYLQADISKIIDQLKIRFITGFLTVATVVIIMAVTISYLFRRRVISHIIDIANFLRESPINEPFTSVSIKKKSVNDEIDFLVDSFNHVLGHLHSTLVRISHREKQTQGLLDAARAIMEYGEFEGVARSLFASCCRMTGATAGYVALLNKKSNNNEVVFLESGGLPCDVDPSLPMPIQGLRALAYSECRVKYDNDFMHSDWVKLLPKGHVALRNVMFAPLIVENEVLGVIGQANKPSDFTDDDAEIAKAIGDMAAVVLQRSMTEAALRESEYFFRESQEAAFIGSYKFQISSGFWESSEVLDRILGIDRNYERSIEGCFDIIHPDDRDMLDQYIREEVIRTRQSLDREFRIIRKSDQEVRWVYGRGRVDFDDQGNFLSMIGTIQDITDLKWAEEERIKLTEQLSQSQKMEYVGRLAGGVAHDFNNMLGVILGNVELILEYDKPGSLIHDELLEIRKAAERSADLTRQLLAFARKQTVSLTVLDLNETVEGMLKMLRRMIGEHINLVWHPSNDLWKVMMDPSQIDQILVNLCVNARDAIIGVGKILIETMNVSLDQTFCKDHDWASPGHFVQLVVKDDGAGMTRETLAHLFEPFYTTKDVGSGTGLGLSTVYGIVKQNNGLINVVSDIDSGTEFRICLPRCEGQDETVMAHEADSANEPGTGTILLVEDEPQVLKMVSAILKSRGYIVLTAETAEVAIRNAEKCPNRIDLLITDVIMPEMNGLDLSRILMATNPDMKCLFMSGYTDDIIARQGVLGENLQFIHKPFSKNLFLKKVNAVLNEGS